MSGDTPEQTTEREFAGGAVTVRLTSVDTGTVRAEIVAGGDRIHQSEYKAFADGKYGRDERGALGNTAEESLGDINGVDASAVGDEIKAWLSELNSAKSEVAIGPLAQEIIDGTKTPVAIREAPDENTTWHVTLTFRGRTKELEFEAGAIIDDSSGLLANKIIHNYHEKVEISPEDWEEISEYWYEHSEVVQRTTVKEVDEVSDRVLSFLKQRISVTHDRENITSGPSSVWLDAENAGGAVGTDGPVAWVRDGILTDELQEAGKKIAYKGQLVKNLLGSGVLFDTPGEQNTYRKPSSWTEGPNQVKVWAFNPEALDLEVETDGSGDGDPSSEVAL